MDQETGCIDNNRFKGKCESNVFMGSCRPVTVTNRDLDVTIISLFIYVFRIALMEIHLMNLIL